MILRLFVIRMCSHLSGLHKFASPFPILEVGLGMYVAARGVFGCLLSLYTAASHQHIGVLMRWLLTAGR